jgi:large subunit ribosomal protein L9
MMMSYLFVLLLVGASAWHLPVSTPDSALGTLLRACTARASMRRTGPAEMLSKKAGKGHQHTKDTKVLLSADVEGVGKKGEIIDVKIAYAQNFIVAKGVGKILTAQIIAELEQERFEKELAAATAKEEAQALATRLEEQFGPQTDGLVLKRKAGPTGKIFGKVSRADVKRLLKEQAKANVDEDHIKIPKIKGVGAENAELKLHKDIKVSVKVSVVPDTR